MYNMRALSGDFNNCPTQSVAYGCPTQSVAYAIKQNCNRISLHQFIYHLFERLFYQSVDIRISGMILLQVIPSILLVEEY